MVAMAGPVAMEAKDQAATPGRRLKLQVRDGPERKQVGSCFV